MEKEKQTNFPGKYIIKKYEKKSEEEKQKRE